MKNLFFIFFLLFDTIVFGQSLSITKGAIHNQFLDFAEQKGHYQSEYESGTGFAIGAIIDGIKIDSLNLRFTIGAEFYQGYFWASGGGIGSRNTTYADVDKALITLGFYPINFRILKRIDLNLGIEIGTLLYEKVNGRSLFSSGFNYSDLAIEAKYKQFNNPFVLGAKASVSYHFKITDNLSVFPQYAYYFGLVSEFSEFPTETKSRRQYFSIGVKQKLGSK